MKKIIPLLVFILYLGFYELPAQKDLNLSALIIPEDLKENAYDVVRFEETIFEVKSIKEGSLYIKKIITILDKKSDANVLYVFYDSDSQIGKIKANIYEASGQLVRKIKDSDFKDQSAIQSFSIYEDNRVKYLEINHPRYPYTVEYEYEIKFKGLGFGAFPDWRIQTYNRAVENATYTLKSASNFKIHYLTLNTSAEAIITENNNTKSYHWKVSNLRSIQSEPYAPPRSEILPMIKFSPSTFQIKQHTGSFDNWNKYGAFIDNLYRDKDQLPTDVLEEIKALTAQTSSNIEKINLLYKYLQENTRYVSVQLGIGGWEPFDATYVSKNKYGDCKALTNYMKSLLNGVGIKAYPVLIKNGSISDPIREDFASPDFNHVILNIPDEDYWLECTSTYNPPNYIGSGNADRNVLLVTEEGGEIIRTPKLTIEQNLEENNAEIKLSADGSASITMASQFTGSKQESLRYVKNELANDEQKKWFKRTTGLPSIKLNRLDIDLSMTVPEVEMRIEGLIPSYASSAGRRIFVPVNQLNAVRAIPDEDLNRKLDLQLNSVFVEKDHYEFHLPKGYVIESLPEAVEIESEFGIYAMNIQVADNKVIYHRTYKRNSGRFPKEKFIDFRKFLLEVVSQDRLMLVLAKKKT